MKFTSNQQCFLLNLLSHRLDQFQHPRKLLTAFLSKYIENHQNMGLKKLPSEHFLNNLEYQLPCVFFSSKEKGIYPL